MVIIDVGFSELTAENRTVDPGRPDANLVSSGVSASGVSGARGAGVLPFRRRLGRTAIFALALSGLGLMLVTGNVPCPFAHAFHVPCPGCGSTRAMLALAHGDLHEYLRYNPFALFMTLIVSVLVLQAFTSVYTTGTMALIANGRLGIRLAQGAALVATLQVVVWMVRFAGFLGGPVPV